MAHHSIYPALKNKTAVTTVSKAPQGELGILKSGVPQSHPSHHCNTSTASESPSYPASWDPSCKTSTTIFPSLSANFQCILTHKVCHDFIPSSPFSQHHSCTYRPIFETHTRESAPMEIELVRQPMVQDKENIRMPEPHTLAASRYISTKA